MNRQELINLQIRVGTKPDGRWGPKSQAALESHLRALMPSPNPWPKGDQASVRAFYGEPADEDNFVWIEFPFATFYDDKPCKRTRCHRKVADSLVRVLKDIYARYGQDERIMANVRDFYGCFNDRSMRGGTSRSMHSWAIAIDYDADENSFRQHWPMQADMPIEIIECFSREGWTSGGAWWNYDAMHFEATRP